MMTTELDEYSEQLSVLVIEDNHGDFVLIEDYLLEKFKQIKIVHFFDYATSVSYLQQTTEKIDAIFLDLHLPDRKGMELINNFLEYTSRIPVVILTGYSDLAIAKKSLQIGIYDYLIKDELNPTILHKTLIFSLNRSRFINQIEDEKQNYENLFHFNPQPTWLLEDHSLIISNANLAAQNKYGYSLDDFIGMSFTQLHPKEEEDLIKNRLNCGGIKLSNAHFNHLLSDGTEIKVDIFSSEINNNKKNSLIVQSNDVSKTLQRISTIEIQNKKLKKIAWTQSHVVRAPISRILGIINLIEDQPETIEAMSFWLTQLRISTNEMDSIVKKIIEDTNSFDQE